MQFEFGLLCTRVPRTLQVYNKAERQFSVDELDACIGKKFGDTRRPMFYVVLIVYVRVCVFLIFCVCVCVSAAAFVFHSCIVSGSGGQGDVAQAGRDVEGLGC